MSTRWCSHQKNKLQYSALAGVVALLQPKRLPPAILLIPEKTKIQTWHMSDSVINY